MKAQNREMVRDGQGLGLRSRSCPSVMVNVVLGAGQSRGLLRLDHGGSSFILYKWSVRIVLDGMEWTVLGIWVCCCFIDCFIDSRLAGAGAGARAGWVLRALDHEMA
jgi:hypothetical protein